MQAGAGRGTGRNLTARVPSSLFRGRDGADDHGLRSSRPSAGQGVPLVNDVFEFPDLLGAAYEYLIKEFADSAGKYGGQFYTPPWVVRLMVRLIDPKPKMGIYDPTVGSGGMLIQCSQYVSEQAGDGTDLDSHGQDSDGGVVSIAKMNLILHNLQSSHIEFGNTLEEPHNEKDGALIQFDRVIANPPFAQNWTLSRCKRPERFQYGHAPQTEKKADLMFLQHMLASLKSTGRGAVVMAHGVLFRGRKERTIRMALLRARVIEAIIGLPPKLFYGTGIPAVIIILNKSITDNERDHVFLINADREFAEGKKQNQLRPEDIEKIVHVFQHRIEEDKYSRRVALSVIETDHDWNLNLRRYVDNTPPPDPEDVRCHLHGGVPRAEVDGPAATRQLTKFQLSAACVFDALDAQRFAFKPDLTSTVEVRRRVEKRYTRSRCNAGDLLISIKATTGRIGVAPVGFSGNISRDLARVRFAPSEFPHFFKYQLQSAAGQSRLDAITVGMTRKELSIIPLRGLLMARPKPPEQEAIALKIQKLEADLMGLEGQISKFKLLKNGLMRDLLTGRVPVTPLLANPKATTCPRPSTPTRSGSSRKSSSA